MARKSNTTTFGSLYNGKVNYIIMLLDKLDKPFSNKWVTYISYSPKQWRAKKGCKPYIFDSREVAEDTAFGITVNGCACAVVEIPDVYNGLFEGLKEDAIENEKTA